MTNRNKEALVNILMDKMIDDFTSEDSEAQNKFWDELDAEDLVDDDHGEHDPDPEDRKAAEQAAVYKDMLKW